METVDGVLCCTGIDAVAMDSLDRTRSRGYVVPGIPREGISQGQFLTKQRNQGDVTGKGGLDEQTEVIPAKAPAASRMGVSNVFFPLSVKSWRERRVSIES